MGTITKALTLLNHFSASEPEITLSQFKRISAQDKATVYRHLSELQDNGFLEQDAVTKAYRLGPALLRLSAIRERAFPLRKLVSSWADDLSRELEELVHVCVLDGNVMSPIYHANLHNHGTRVQFDEAELLPLHATSAGLTMLAFGAEELCQNILGAPLEAYTPKTLIDTDDLMANILETRGRGYSYTDQGFEADVCSFAVPFFNEASHPVGSVAVALPTSRMNKAAKQKIIDALFTNSAGISHSLGGQIPSKIEHLWNKAASK